MQPGRGKSQDGALCCQLVLPPGPQGRVLSEGRAPLRPCSNRPPDSKASHPAVVPRGSWLEQSQGERCWGRGSGVGIPASHIAGPGEIQGPPADIHVLTGPRCPGPAWLFTEAVTPGWREPWSPGMAPSHLLWCPASPDEPPAAAPLPRGCWPGAGQLPPRRSRGQAGPSSWRPLAPSNPWGGAHRPRGLARPQGALQGTAIALCPSAAGGLSRASCPTPSPWAGKEGDQSTVQKSRSTCSRLAGQHRCP